ncbi:MAG: RNA polymerase sigma-70 factor [Tannerellaceae bacterium]|jgi:RNA polymerase sigma-70 factor (ECF subfamily)|nr:RNA polymerase sigma-70 factor [Tannerellaceae bacterium]
MKNHVIIDKNRMIEAMNQGEQEVFNLVFSQYFSKVKRFLAGFLDHSGDAEDLAQDVFVKLWESRSLLPCIDNLNAYIYSMSRNILYDHLKRSGRIKYHFTDSMPDVADINALYDLLFAGDLEKHLDRIIESMPSQRKTVFTLSRKDGLSNDEIAACLQISRRTVETHISAALSDIRKVIGKR